MSIQAAAQPLTSRHWVALGLLCLHATFLMLVLTLVETSKTVDAGTRQMIELGVTAMLGLGMVFFFLYSKWLSPAKANALIQVVNVAMGTTLFSLTFPDQRLEPLQWAGIAFCSAGIVMMIARGESRFFLHPVEGAAEDAEIGPRRRPLRLLLGIVAIGVVIWALTLDSSALGEGGALAVLEDRANALNLFSFEVAATTLVPLAAKVAASQRTSIRVLVSLCSLALLGVSLFFFFYYSNHVSIPKSNAILQTVNTSIGTLFVAFLFPDERLNTRQWLGVALCVIGVAFTLGLYDGDIEIFRKTAYAD